MLRGAARTGWALLVVHLSRLPPPGPRPYHRRLTAALLDDTAERCSGQIFALASGDLALLFRPTDEGAAATGLIGRLFGTERPDPAALRSLWPLPEMRDAALAYLNAQPREAVGQAGQPDEDDPASRPAGAPWGEERKTRQTAIQLRPGHAERIRPLFRELLTGPAGRMEAPLLRSVLQGMRADDVALGGRLMPLHLNLDISGVLSEGFARLAEAHKGCKGGRLGVEMPLAQAVEAPAALLLARERLRLAGMGFVLDQVTHEALRALRPEFLKPDWVKLQWCRALPEAGLGESIRRMGGDRIVLSGCDTEGAMVWGLSAGVQRFQGRFVEAMLAAERMRACPAAQGCSLTQCQDRAGAIDPEGWEGCSNRTLLEASTPGFLMGKK